jgi:hypothetical protein
LSEPRASWGLRGGFTKVNLRTEESRRSSWCPYQPEKMSSFRKTSSRILEQERQRGAVRKTAIQAALSKPPPPRVSKENWTDWNRYGWFTCPGNRRRTCSASACGVGASCQRMGELGLSGDGSPLRRKDRPRCVARTRAGEPCLVRVEPGKRRCRFHGGLSTGPRTAEGKARIAAAQRRRWRTWRSRNQGGQRRLSIGC